MSEEWRTEIRKLMDRQHELEAQRALLLAELQNIANAKPSVWDETVRDQFREWAQNRARHAIQRVTP